MDPKYVTEQLTAIEEKINKIEEKIKMIEMPDKTDKTDKISKPLPMLQAKYDYFLAVQRALNKTAALADIGLLDGINDSLQRDGWVGSSETFYHGKDPA